MGAAQLLLTASASLVASACFLLVAVALRRRRYSPELQSAGQAYVLWWAMFSLQALTDAWRVLLGLADPLPTGLYVALAFTKIVLGGIAFWALGRYVLFLWNGRRGYSMLILAFAALHAGFFLFAFQRSLPAQVVVDEWSTRLVLAGPGLGVRLGNFGALAYFLPPLLMAIAYFALLRRMETRTQRVRVASIGAAVLLFHLVATIQFNPGTPASSPLFAVLPLVSAAVGLLVFATYRPPAWITRRFGIEPVGNEENPGRPSR